MIEVNLVLNFNSQSLERKLALDYVDLLVGGIKVRESEREKTDGGSEMSIKNMVWNCLRKGHLRG